LGGFAIEGITARLRRFVFPGLVLARQATPDQGGHPVTSVTSFQGPIVSALRADQDQCLACGGTVEAHLVRLASPRCLDCREDDRPIDPELYEQFHRSLTAAQVYDLEFPSLGVDEYEHDLDSEAVEYRDRRERRAA
jgi:hypothetical protein